MECAICQTLTPHLKGLISHLRLTHGQDEDFSAPCPVDLCDQRFGSFGALNSHIYRRHRDVMNLDAPSTVAAVPGVQIPSFEHRFVNDTRDVDFVEQNTDELYDVAHLLGTGGVEQERESAGFLLKLREVRQISQTATLDVIQGSHVMFGRTLLRVKAVIKDVLHQNGITYSDVQGLDSAISNLSPPYQNLHSIHKQDVIFKEHFNMLEPVEVTFTERCY